MSGELLERNLLFVTGKGGVGKTSVAAALADLAAKSGLRVLLCEMDAKGDVATAFDAEALDFAPRELEPGLFAMAMNTEDSLREYLRLFVKVPLVGRIGPLARTFDFVADAAPGVKEILAVGKLTYEVRSRTTTSWSWTGRRAVTSSPRSARRESSASSCSSAWSESRRSG